MEKIAPLVFLLSLLYLGASSSRLVTYWGQNGSREERSLLSYCQSSEYDTIIIGFVNEFFPKGNNGYPGINLSKHCGNPRIDGYKKLFYCKKIEAAIKVCQANGKKVQIGLGGSTSKGLQDASQGKELADRVFDMFLTDKEDEPHPFGSTTLDGVNLAVAQGKWVGYQEFVARLRKLMDASRLKLTLSVTPQCSFPDRLLAPTFKTQGEKIDEIYVQFYNNHCRPSGDTFYKSLHAWFNMARQIQVQYNKSPKVYVGLLADSESEQFQKLPSLKFIYKQVKDEANFGGIMLYDAGFDEIGRIKGIRYSRVVKGVLNGIAPKNTTTTTTTTPEPTTEATTTLEPTTVSPTDPTDTSGPDVTTTAAPTTPRDYKVVVNWGFNYARGEKNLLHYCKRRAYDVILINTLTVFFSSQNAGDLPALEFAKHCNGKRGFGEDYPTYQKCMHIGEDIEKCQKYGKKVLLTLGGTSRWIGFGSKAKAELFAFNLWKLFMGGSSKLRAFGDVEIDGVNINLPYGGADYFLDFIRRMRALMDSHSRKNKKYLITASAACPFPNVPLGNVFEQAGTMIDAFYLNFGEDGCSYHKPKSFNYALKQWMQLKPDLYIGVPAAPKATYNEANYVKRSEIHNLIKKYVLPNKQVAGMLVSDTSYEDKNINSDGERFSDVIGKLLHPEMYVGKTPWYEDDRKKIELVRRTRRRRPDGSMVTAASWFLIFMTTSIFYIL